MTLRRSIPQYMSRWDRPTVASLREVWARPSSTTVLGLGVILMETFLHVKRVNGVKRVHGPWGNLASEPQSARPVRRDFSSQQLPFKTSRRQGEESASKYHYKVI